MSQNKVLSTIYEQLRLIKQTPRKNIVLLKNRNNGELSIAKVQLRNQNPNNNDRTVRHQGKFLLQSQGHIGIPTMRWVGKDGPYDVLIVEKLGKTLVQLFEQCNYKFSLKTVCMLGIKMLKIIQNYHSKGFVHRNINPGAFQIGIGFKNAQLYFNDLIDSLSYLNKKTLRHIQNKGTCKMTYLTHFMTIEQILGGQSSRRTDIQSTILMLIYFMKGQLPWTQVSLKNGTMQQKLKKLHEKMQVSPNQLCKGLPKQFQQMLIEARNIEFQQEPMYFYYFQQIHKIMYRANIQNDDVFDWAIKLNSKTNQRTQIQELRANKYITAIKMPLRPYENLVLKTYFEPFYDKVEIDEITQKYAKTMAQSRLKTEQLYEQPWNASIQDSKPKSQKSIPGNKVVSNGKQKDKCIIY